MKRYTTAQARQHFAELLTVAAAGQPVLIERRGVRFVLRADRPRSRRRRPPIIDVIDAAVAEGRWTWTWQREGVRFARRRRR
jgi:antitoxin (DNA-binding transcriptional repressor) of toxin-antitoxin stability system